MASDSINEIVSKEYQRLVTVAKALEDQKLDPADELMYLRALLGSHYLYSKGVLPQDIHFYAVSEIYRVAGLDSDHPDADVFA